MARIAYVNGNYRPISEAAINVEDRGFQFSDGIYEVCFVVDGRLWDAPGHFRRWRYSLAELKMRSPMGERAMRVVINRLLRVNRLSTALVYMQATRGVAPRNHAFPAEAIAPSFVVTVNPFDFAAAEGVAQKGVGVTTAPDIRWARVDIKTISLLPNVLAKDAARRQNAVEAWLHKDGLVTEGAASNAWIIDQNGSLITHPLGGGILGGITRERTLACAAALGLHVEERPFTLEEAFKAREAFITAATMLVMPVISIDGKPVGTGTPGPVATALRRAYIDQCRAENSNS